jgi:hypothetical protein
MIPLHPCRLVILGVAAALCGCTTTQEAGPAPGAIVPASTSITPSDFRLPEGAGCSGDIARWQAIQDNDLRMGHVNQSVYDQIQREIAQAAAACQTGRDREARALVHASKARHGYPG